MREQRGFMAARRWGVRALTLVLACALLAGLGISALALGDPDQGEVVNPVTPQPTVTIQGNLVTENGKPTGFYELALCVQSGYDYRRTVPQNDDEDVISKDAYALLPEEKKAEYAPYYYPFRTVSAAMYINTDVLTAVSWDLSSVRYESFDGTNYDQHDEDYPRGIDTDPAAQGYDMDQEDAFPDITIANLERTKGKIATVALDVEGDTRMTTVEGMAEHYDKDSHTALITLSANAPDNYSVTLRQSTPVVVARFAYDLKRFDATKVMDTGESGSAEQRNSFTGEQGGAGFWMGWDKTDGGTSYATKEALTWLGQSENDQDFTKPDAMIAESAGRQSVWVHMGTGEADAAKRDTYFYYYLAAEGSQPQTKGTTEPVLVAAGGAEPETAYGVAAPKTAGERVLTPGPSPYNQQTAPTAPEELQGKTEGTMYDTSAYPPKYNFFDNLLTLGKKTLVLELVNQPSFRKPTGGYGGNQILFYDWDDKLIGALIVGDGDVRAQVNAYVEQNFIHPDLRAGEVLSDKLGGELPPDLDADTTGYADLVSSLDRDYTYRGKYAYQVGGDDTSEGRADGPEYPLTNKLDYVFTKRVNTIVTQTDDDGNETRYVHPYALDDDALADTDAALYPYVYGWAVVEDPAAANGRVDAAGDAAGTWKTMHDAAKLEDTWTTFGTGELSDMKRADMAAGLSAFAADPAATVAYSAPAFLAESDPTWTDGSRPDAGQYLYQLSGESGYLRFADFSDITAEMARYQNKNTLIVKAVYEEGTSLMDGTQYTLMTEPAYSKWNTVAAASGGAYKVQLTMERSYDNDGKVQGTTRVRTPSIRQDNTIDYKWLSDEERDILNDMDNADLTTARGLTETTYTKVDYDTGEEVTFSLSLSARHNRVDYRLIEQYGFNFVTGVQRSYTNNDILTSSPEKFVVNNYNYLLTGDSNTLDDLYDSDFATKEGTQGFVLLGTLGDFLERATQVNHGEMAQLDYENAVTFRVAQDANLRMDEAGTQPAYSDNPTIQAAFLAAAKRCEEHKDDPDYADDCWDKNLDCAKLTYHQAQLFLLDYQKDPACDIRKASEADGEKLPFCHYHVSCTGGHVPVPPRNWAELTAKLKEYREAVADSDEAKNAKADLSALELNTLNTMTNLRADGSGARYTSASDFIDALLAAEKALTEKGLPVSWVNLQYTLLHSNTPGEAEAMKTEAQTNYWWYNGAANAPAVNSFEALLAAAATARTETTLPDGTADFLPQSALAAAKFSDDATAYLTTPSPTRAQTAAWVALTDNLVPSHKRDTMDEGEMVYTTGKFSDMAAFLEAFNAAYDEVNEKEPKPEDAKAWWEAIQTAILQKTKPDDDLGDYDKDGTTRFWWRGGNTPFKITNFTTLVEAARRLNAEDHETAEYKAAEAEWERLEVKDIESAAISQSLRWKGDDELHPMYPYAAAEDADPVFETLSGGKAAILTQLQSAVKRFDEAAAANPAVVLSWQNIQYLILNNKDEAALPAESVVRAQANYYWWQNGNTTGAEIELNASPMSDALTSNMRTLLPATYRSDFNDPGVIQSLLNVADGVEGAKTFWSATRLITEKEQGGQFDRGEYDSYDGPDNEEEARSKAFHANDEDDARELLTALSAYRDARKTQEGVSDPYGMPSAMGWHYVQYYLLHKNEDDPHLPADQYIAMLDQEKAKTGDYWWYFVDERVPPAKPVPGLENPAAELLEWLKQLEDGSMDVDTFNSYLTVEKFTAWGIYQLDGSEADEGFIEAVQIGMCEDLPIQLAGAGLTVSDLTWPQLQALFGGYGRDWGWNILTSEEEALNYLVSIEGAKLQSAGGYIPDGYAALYPELFPGYAALPTPFEVIPLEALDTEDLLEKKAELERQLAQVEEQLAALEEAQTAQTTPSTPSRPSQTPARPETPVEPETPAPSKPSEATDTTAPSEPTTDNDSSTSPEPPTQSPSEPTTDGNSTTSPESPTQSPSEPTTDGNSTTSHKIPGERAEIPMGDEVVLAGRGEAEQVRPTLRPNLPGVRLLLAVNAPLLAEAARRRGRRRR